MTAVLRELEWTDIDTLARLEADLFADDAWSVQTWWAELAGRPRRDYVVAVDPVDPLDPVDPVDPVDPRHGERIVGYGGIDVAGDVADVMTIATVREAQGRGLGRQILDDLVRRAERSGATALLLEVRADNAAARRLYDATGFEVISVRRRYYQPGDVDALVMRKLIGGTHG
ncbi:ribosomal protein S18-alanine N-acetyltransferase [Intrasporangium sp.]|uniref:ribosomal protein S18-alanine N-acetyltransferase n=1 Tax=Intrasporangium sp. TaxID=1925024 RepID=UPI00293B7B73|nr:ribosomal protein S18-alanine N-acetyltransferase [Intrasporangium sp.]MDV3223287.1 ribosomal protein S18-alanine N-acetyltransferase [Intrasporangium sp.]